MRLAELLKPFVDNAVLKADWGALEIGGLSSDSRYAKAGDLFFALRGEHSHGLAFLNALREKKVSAIVYEAAEGYEIPSDLPTIEIENLTALLPKIGYAFYQNAIENLTLMGVTGTEGKTSVTQFVAQAFEHLGQSCALIGTNGIGFLGELKENTHTTPDLLALYRSLSEINQAFDAKDADKTMNQAGADKRPCTLEVTSHALAQKRVENLRFLVTAQTNLTRDHLDYHGTIEAYAAEKAKLFYEYESVSSVLNIDDELGESLYHGLQERIPNRILYPYGQGECDHPNFLQIQDLTLTHSGLAFTLQFQGKQYALESPLYGSFNAYNLTAMVGILLSYGIEMEAIVGILPKITHVKGRMERVELKNGAVALVDYAHKPNALLQALKSLREHLSEGQLTVVFGCGGDRDRGKRPLMAEIAEAHADRVVITSDNPRSEDPQAIIDEIKTGLRAPERATILEEISRQKAIAMALSQTQKGDIVLVAGKGHEDYQILADRVIHFSDIEEIERFNRE